LKINSNLSNARKVRSTFVVVVVVVVVVAVVVVVVVTISMPTYVPR
jgi:hypothetical protein